MVFFDRGTLVSDIAGLIQALGGRGSVHLVGQDWGAGIVYGVLAAFPELIRRAVVMAVPHPARSAESALDPKHVHRSFHWWFFQLPDLPEKAHAANDFAFVDYLWEHWTSAGYRDPAHIAQIKLMLKEPGALAATLGYYRAMFDARKIDPNLDSLRRSMERPIAVPTLALCGEEDLRAELMSDRRNILPANIACQNQLGDYVNQGYALGDGSS